MANTVTYLWPPTGSIPPVAPTGTNIVKGMVITDGETAETVITHNLGDETGLAEITLTAAANGNFYLEEIAIMEITSSQVTLVGLGEYVAEFYFIIRRQMPLIS